ncbi:upstream activation factor subunit spp27 isoform X2 [Trichoplusia ni]|uniref:Upstream activation factor subunit spp27 isoform X2 n=1 Tax=Trichoplusia ni TaxID=7111 RepID=A0A7E5VNJ3_TRINI|nr:upstream activation factor subunit spp27 isoform X2 [Trichoplusia ni]
MEDITEEELRREITEILKNASLANTSTKKVIQKLEKKLGLDLSEKKKLIDQLVMDYVNELDSESDEAEEEEEVVVNKKKKKPADDEEEEERDDSNDSDWGSGKKKKVEEKKKKATPKAKKGGGVTKRGKGSGYTRAYKLSPALAELMGETELPRHEVVKRVWAIIKEKQLFDPNNRQFAICDKALFKVIGTQRFHTFGMMKYLKNHFID